MSLAVVHTLEELQLALLGFARAGKRVALVPTMGALHAGHASLITRARHEADVVVVTIFVNPTQFGPTEDFDRYPRTLDADMLVAQEAGAALIYAPSVEDMYPEGSTTRITAGEMGTVLCGAFRPGHFDGVATVVAKLLLRTMPHVALFGKKDYQQLCVIKRVVNDLDIPVEIVGVPTLRERDGLAMSSRNRYLGAQERILAPKLYETMTQVQQWLARSSVSDALAEGVVALTASGFHVEYLELRDGETLAPITTYNAGGGARLLVAAWLGETRLIDNIEVE
jgi:pantoate--beta-alanine ligase